MLIAAKYIWSDGGLNQDMALEDNGISRRIRPLGADTPDMTAHLITPAFTDLQVNGGAGVLFNSDPTPEGLDLIAAAHARLGTAAILPTIITDAPDVVERGAAAVLARQNDPHILGLHIEGPHISPDRRGTHKAEFIRPLDARTLALVERLCGKGVPVMITLAPEQTDPANLHRLIRCGAIVSLGHSSATVAQTEAALEAGAGCFTHLFNGMDPMTSRNPGLLGVALTDTRPAGIIADGHHVDWRMLRLAIRARPGPVFAVSDAMPTVGGPRRFDLYGQTISVKDGKLVNHDGSLAGAHIDMATSFGNLIRHVGLPIEEAVAMCTDIPRAVLGLAPQSASDRRTGVVAFDEEYCETTVMAPD